MRVTVTLLPGSRAEAVSGNNAGAAHILSLPATTAMDVSELLLAVGCEDGGADA